MDVNVHHQLLDLADWIKIDFQATAYLEKQFTLLGGEKIIAHFLILQTLFLKLI